MLVAGAAASLAVASCGGGSGAAAGDATEISLAHSYTEDQPQHRCGAQVIADQVNDQDLGVEVVIYPNSQLGGDADRISSVVSGDIDMDFQGSSALGAVYSPFAAVDAAYAFDDAEHLARFFEGDASDALKDGFLEETGVRALGAWSTGMRHFTANEPIREPGLQGVRMRFPNSPMYLLNAEALGARATEVAYEELYLALQQGVVDGQENPITNIAALNLPEVQDYISLTSHQASSNVIIIGEVWDTLSSEQQQALGDAVQQATERVPQCVAEEEEETLSQWRQAGDIEVVDDVNVEAFASKARAYLQENLEPGQLEVYEAIRGAAQ